MSRYIDADKLKEECFKFTNDVSRSAMAFVQGQINAAPTADVVEVVRCRDCKFWGIPHANDIEKAHYCCRDNMWCMPLRFADDYCSYGKRREG